MPLTQHALQILRFNAQVALLNRCALPKSPEVHLALQTRSFSWCKPSAQAQAQAAVERRGENMIESLEPMKAARSSPQLRVLAESASHRFRDLGMEEPVVEAFHPRAADGKGKTSVLSDAAGALKWEFQSPARVRSRAELFAIMREGFAAMRDELSNKVAVSFDDRIESWIREVDSAMQEPFSGDDETVETAQPDAELSDEMLALKHSKKEVVNQVNKTCDDVVLPIL